MFPSKLECSSLLWAAFSEGSRMHSRFKEVLSIQVASDSHLENVHIIQAEISALSGFPLGNNVS